MLCIYQFFSCFFFFFSNNNKIAVDVSYNYVIDQQPIGRILFRSFCEHKRPLYFRYIAFLDSVVRWWSIIILFSRGFFFLKFAFYLCSMGVSVCRKKAKKAMWFIYIYKILWWKWYLREWERSWMYILAWDGFFFFIFFFFFLWGGNWRKSRELFLKICVVYLFFSRLVTRRFWKKENQHQTTLRSVWKKVYFLGF